MTCDKKTVMLVTEAEFNFQGKDLQQEYLWYFL